MSRSQDQAALDIGVFLSSLGLIRGGLETRATRLVNPLVRRGHTMTLVTGYRPGVALSPELAELPVQWLRVPCVPAQLPGWGRIARRRPGWPLKVQSLSFAMACRLHSRVRQVVAAADVTLTFLEVETVKISGWRRQEDRPNVSFFPGVIDLKWLRRDCSAVRVATSRTVAEQSSRAGAGLVIDGVVHPGIPDEWLEAPYTVRPRAENIIFVGRLEANKGVGELLSIFAALAKEFPRLRLHLVGDGPLRPMVQSAFAEPEIAKRVLCMGAVPPARVWQALQQADIFVFPSHYESFGIAVLEALAVGTPVVASALPGIREVADGAAHLAPSADQAAWLAAIRALILDRGCREQLSRRGRERARTFTWDRAAKELEQYLYRAVGGLP